MSAPKSRPGTAPRSAERRVKVLVVSPTPPPYSGPEVMTQQLLDSPLRDWYELIHYNISKQRSIKTKGRFDLGNLIFGLLQPLKLIWFLLRHRPALVYTLMPPQNLPGFLRYAVFVLISAAFRTRVVVRFPGVGWDHFYPARSAAVRWMIRFVLRRVDGFIIRANALKEEFDGLVPRGKLHTVYSGICLSPYDKGKPAAVSGSRRSILYVGYLTQAKGALDLLRAIPHVTSRHPDTVFRFVGESVDIERAVTRIANPASNDALLRSLLAEDGVAGHVEFPGLQLGEDKVRSFLEADIFVLPSYAEAFPTVVLEAMAAGLPVVATPVGALPEAFSPKHILFVTPGDVEGLAAALDRLLGDPELRRRMGEANRALMEENFDDRAYARRVDRVFRLLLNGELASDHLVRDKGKQAAGAHE